MHRWQECKKTVSFGPARRLCSERGSSGTICFVKCLHRRRSGLSCGRRDAASFVESGSGVFVPGRVWPVPFDGSLRAGGFVVLALQSRSMETSGARSRSGADRISPAVDELAAPPGRPVVCTWSHPCLVRGYRHRSSRPAGPSVVAGNDSHRVRALRHRRRRIAQCHSLMNECNIGNRHRHGVEF